MMPGPPYIWFGGKRAIAPLVWDALGDVDNYVEPFFGGGSVWLLRPHTPRVETINDYDGFVANFWRAVQAEPDAVADAMNWPVNEIDMEARHRWLCKMPDKEEFLKRMKHDPDHYDVKRAAWWCWGLNACIGRGWCEGEYWADEPAKSHGRGVCDGANKLPALSDAGQGIHRRRPHLGRDLGIHRKRPHLGNAGQGVHRQLPHLGGAGQGECERRGAVLRQWMQALADRLRNVRVCCGDWARICTDGATAHGATVGAFLDPPYAHAVNRDTKIYRCEDATVSDRVREWCVERTGQPRYRIVLAGYDGEHDELESIGWRVVPWKAHGGMGNTRRGKNSQPNQGRVNAGRERLWFSPSCVQPDDAPLFQEAG